MNEIINSKVNVWDVIDTYFRDEPYYKSQHQVDSFNEFIYYKENKQTYKNANKIAIYLTIK